MASHDNSELDRLVAHAKELLKSYQQSGTQERLILTIDLSVAIQFLNYHASQYLHQGKLKLALDLLTLALEAARTCREFDSEGLTLNIISDVYRAWGRYQEALDYLRQVLEIDRKAGDRVGESITLYRMGLVYEVQERYEEALDNFQEALKIARKVGYQAGESYILEHFGSVYYSLGQFQEALDHLNQALEIVREVGNLDYEGILLTSIGRVYRRIGSFVEGFRALKDAADICEVLVGKVPFEGIRQSYRATKLDIYNSIIYLLFEWVHTAGEGIDSPAELLLDAVRFLELGKAREIVDKLEPGKPRKDLLKICPEMQKIVEEEQRLADQLLELEHRDATARQALAAARATGSDITSLEGLRSISKVELEQQRSKLKELRHKIMEWCADPGLVRPTSSFDPIPSFKAIFDYCPDAIIWEFFFDHKVTADKFWILVWSRERIGLFPSSFLDLEKAITCLQRFHKLLERAVKEPQKQQVHIAGANKQLAEISQLLGGMLPDSLWQTLEGKELLILIPHERLHLFPWSIAQKPSSEAAKGGDATDVSSSYLGLQVPLVRSYSLSLVVSCLKREQMLPPKFLLVVNPTGDLQGPKWEMKSIEKLLDSLAPKHKDLGKLRHKQATKNRFVEKVKEAPSVIHFAGHGVFDGEDPWLSCLKFYDAKGPSSYTVTDMLLNRFPGSPLFVLSACETARGVISRGDEAVGILRGLTLAGATSILATNWLLTDMVAPYFMRYFYTFFFQGQSAAQALFNARLELYENHSEFREPLYWAVYELYGNPFKQLKLDGAHR